MPAAPSQGRNAIYLIANTGVGAATGVLFWFLAARVLGLPPADVGAGYAIIAMGTIAGVLALGGFDTAVLRHVPKSSRRDGLRLTLLAIASGMAIVLTLTLLAWLSLGQTGGLAQLDGPEWLLLGGIGVLLAVTWIQDAYFVARGNALPSLHRNMVFSISRIALLAPLVLLTFPFPIAGTWMVALLISALAAWVFMMRVPAPGQHAPPVRPFFRSAWRNISGSAAQTLPGLLLAPAVLIFRGPEAAAYFGIAWSAASLLFLACGAISRSALAEMVRRHRSQRALILRRAAAHHAWIVAPGIAVAIIVAPVAMSAFGQDYVQEGTTSLRILIASTIFVAPAYLYLSVLRARDGGLALLLLPTLTISLLALLAPTLTEMRGIEGMASAWLLANVPFGIYSAFRLLFLAKEVRYRGPDAPAGQHAPTE